MSTELPVAAWFPAPATQRGLSLIELIVFIMIVSIALVGVLSVLNLTVWHSADPAEHKRMLSIAEALLEEVELQPFSYCDPTDPNWATATSATLNPGDLTGTQCTTTVEALGAEAGETRSAGFNDVTDYSGLNLPSPITDISGNATAPAGYSAAISVTPEALGGVGSAATLDMVRIRVTVCRSTSLPCPAGADSISLEGYRARYWPNDLPW